MPTGNSKREAEVSDGCVSCQTVSEDDWRFGGGFILVPMVGNYYSLLSCGGDLVLSIEKHMFRPVTIYPQQKTVISPEFDGKISMFCVITVSVVRKKWN